VFGRAVGAAIPVGGGDDAGLGTPGEAVGVAAGATEGAAAAAAAPRSITAAELASHNTAASCWVSIDGQVYDFSEFLEEHPAGAQSILDYGGQDGTVVFDTIHSRSMLDDFEPIGACTTT
jgi:cytochrome b involved in lipid metabolism